MERSFDMPLIQAELKAILHYDPIFGVFKRHGSTRKTGAINGAGYLQIRVNRRICLAHRLAVLWMTGSWPAELVDHIDGNRLNNRYANLRQSTYRQNAQNLRAAHSDCGSGLLGAYRSGPGYQAKIMVNGKIINLGSFPTADMAHAEYIKAKRQLHEACTI